MALGAFEWYLLGINLVGFILYGINMFLHSHTANGHIDAVLTVVSVLGGSIGIFLFILLFDRKSVKENMMSRVFLISVMVIQIVLYLFFTGKHPDKLNFAFWDFFAAHKWLTVYLPAVNVVALAAFGIDKLNAVKGRRRIRIVTLLGLALAGGSAGSLIGMYLFKHKTKKDYFSTGVPLIMIMQAVVIFYLMNI